MQQRALKNSFLGPPINNVTLEERKKKYRCKNQRHQVNKILTTFTENDLKNWHAFKSSLEMKEKYLMQGET